MTGVFGGRNGVLTGRNGVLAPVDQQISIDDFGRGNLAPYESLYAEYGGVTSAAAYTGVYGYRSPEQFTTEIESQPGDGLEEYPKSGTEFGYVTRYEISDEPWQLWFIFGGSGDRYPRYQLEFIDDETFRVQIRDSDGNRYTVANDDDVNVDWIAYEWTWLVGVIVWYDADESNDGNKRGVRALLFEANDFPFTTWSSEAYDADEFDVEAIADVAWPYGDYPDGTGDVPQGLGRVGYRGSINVSHDVSSVTRFV
ncbi:hypothetical protein [Natrononativus amylolyticus]|uniref:hypothetical protein n=1 Tax=Natrononativus amylolyticus TaxID=2963434 RepID=UPI0020CD5F43|nr:hypothetical protein [Natrononativus amylolyticus]